jgi:uncharacterized damage-inducible protein DinB
MPENNNKNIELLFYMLDDIRRITLKGISGLTKEQLFQPPVEGEFPIGAYIMHLGECDLGWLSTISGEEQPAELKKRVYYSAWFDTTPEEFAPPKEALEVDEYVNAITEARKRLREYMLSMDDNQLEDKITRKYADREKTYSKKWIIYHLIEHEAHTRGQMFMLIRMAGFKKKGENN